jgi:hypothetical protein
MKKILYLFLVLPLVFSSCKKEDEKIQGCTDSTASNYNSDAEESDGSCEYSIIASWELDQIWIDNQDVTGSFFEFDYTFNDDNTTYYEFSRAVNGYVESDSGSEVYSINGSTITCVDVVDSEIAIWTLDDINGTQLHISATLNGSLWDVYFIK